jgi:hypothetical protein
VSVGGEQRSRLHRRARRLRPHPRKLPYYLHTPNPANPTQEPAPGWYIVLGSMDAPTYLGASAFEAETALVKMEETNLSEKAS